MKFLLTYLTMIFTAVVSMAQSIPWQTTPTSVAHTINISKANITVDKVPIEAGDVIGVFYDSMGTLACGGLAVWPANTLTAYGDDTGIPNGFSDAGFGESFKFKIWKKETNKIIDSGSIIQFKYQPPTYPDSIFFKVGGNSKLITLKGAKKNVFYAKHNYCIGDADPTPIKGNIPDLTFSSQPGLSINTSTGLINIAASQQGNYTVYFHTSLGLVSNSYNISIKLNTDNLKLIVTNSTCTEKGQIQIDESSIKCGTAPYQYRLRNILDGQNTNSANASITGLEEATYELFITDNTGAESKWVNPVVISKDCQDLVIAPYSTNQTSYYISFEGKARIYDRFGLLKKELSIPGNWDATDNSGNLVPMGQYVIICNEDKQIVVSVIK